MNCNQLRDLYSDYADGTLDEAAEISVRRHLAACPGCRRLDEAFRRGVCALRGLPRVRASGDFDARLQERILRACRESGPEPILGVGQFAGVAGALAVVVVAGILGWKARANDTALELESAAPRAARQARVHRPPAPARFASDTAFGRNPFRMLPASADTALAAPHRIEITVDWMAP